MADNTVLNPGVGGDTFRDKDRSGVKTPVSLIDVGGAGAEKLLTAGLGVVANAVPVALASDHAAVPVAIALTPKYAWVDVTASGVTALVALVAGKKIRVLSWFAQADAAVNLYFKSHTGGQISATKRLLANQSVSKAESSLGHFETVAGEALEVNLSTAANVGIDLVYVEV